MSTPSTRSTSRKTPARGRAAKSRKTSPKAHTYKATRNDGRVVFTGQPTLGLLGAMPVGYGVSEATLARWKANEMPDPWDGAVMHNPENGRTITISRE